MHLRSKFQGLIGRLYLPHTDWLQLSAFPMEREDAYGYNGPCRSYESGNGRLVAGMGN